MKKFKIKDIKHDMLEGIYKTISDVISGITPLDDMEKLLFANIHRLLAKMSERLLPYKIQHKYTISLTVEEALALRIFFNEYIDDCTTSVGNTLHMLSNKIDQFYQ